MKYNTLNLTLTLLPLLMLGCSESSDSGSEAGVAEGSGGRSGGVGTSQGGSDGPAIGGSSSGGSNGGTSAGGSSSEAFVPWGMCASAGEAGTPLLNPEFIGKGSCQHTSLEEVIAAIHETHPELANVTTLFEDSDDGFYGVDNLIYTFEKSDGGMQLAFFQGSGDCPSGCIDKSYIYFETDESCAPERVGSFSSVSNNEENCRDVSGTPLWGVPAGRPSNTTCAAEGKFANFEGSFEVPFKGRRLACSEKGGDAPEEMVSGTLTMTITQSQEDLEHGTVSFSGDELDPAWLGAEPYAVHFDYFQAQLSSEWDNLPAACAETRTVDMYLDFEGCSASELNMFEFRDFGCGDCKGDLNLELDLSGIQLSLHE